MQIDFTKYHGSGNDFIVIDDQSLKFPTNNTQLISNLCHRRFGIGADGLLLIQPSATADFKMALFNPDGSRVDQCGNALRCLTDFIYHKKKIKGKITVEIGKRTIPCLWQNDLIAIDLGSYTWVCENIKIDHFCFQLIDIGVPHAICFVESFKDFIEKAPHLRLHKALGPQGANINFVQSERNTLLIKTFERGIEEEVFSCTSGAATACIVAKKKYNLQNPITVIPKSNQPLIFEVSPHNVRSLGKATYIFHGQITIESPRP
jgi:diaminopimelate epimerase